VLDSVWVDRVGAVAAVAALPGPTVEVFCECDLDVMKRRYLDRAESRGAGHFDLQRESQELWNQDSLQPLAGGWPVISVNTATEVDIAAVAAAVTQRFIALPPRET
jgi:hypothetical protein